MKSHFKDNTYSLAKSLHHINIAKEYLHDVRRDTKGPVKNLFNNYILKCDWILNNINHRLTDTSRIVLKKELDDSFALEAINDKLIHLDSNQRSKVELFIDKMISNGNPS